MYQIHLFLQRYTYSGLLLRKRMYLIFYRHQKMIDIEKDISFTLMTSCGMRKKQTNPLSLRSVCERLIMIRKSYATKNWVKTVHAQHKIKSNVQVKIFACNKVNAKLSKKKKWKSCCKF